MAQESPLFFVVSRALIPLSRAVSPLPSRLSVFPPFALLFADPVIRALPFPSFRARKFRVLFRLEF